MVSTGQGGLKPHLGVAAPSALQAGGRLGAPSAAWCEPPLPAYLPACPPLPACSDIYGKRSDRVLGSLWQTLLLNLALSATNPRIDNWWGPGAGPRASACKVEGCMAGREGRMRACRQGAS